MDLKVKKVLNTKALNSKFEDREMDCLVELEDDSVIIIEIQSSKLTKNKVYSIIDYIKYVEDNYKKITRLGIIFANNNKDIEGNNYRVNKCFKLTPLTYSFNKENGDEVLNRLKNKIKNNKKLSQNDKVDLALISLYSTSKSVDKIAKEGAILISQIKNLSQSEIDKIVNSNLMIINKTVKSEKVRIEIRKCLKMQQVSILREEREEGIKEGRQEGIEEGIKEGRQEGIEEGIKEGRQEGIEEGIKEGRQEGIEEERMSNVKSLRDNGFTTEEISKLLGLKEANVNSLLSL